MPEKHTTIQGKETLSDQSRGQVSLVYPNAIALPVQQPPLDARFAGKHNGCEESLMPRGVVVARQPLELESLVRAQAGQPSFAK